MSSKQYLKVSLSVFGAPNGYGPSWASARYFHISTVTKKSGLLLLLHFL